MPELLQGSVEGWETPLSVPSTVVGTVGNDVTRNYGVMFVEQVTKGGQGILKKGY